MRKILMVVDTPDWAFSKEVDAVCGILGNKYSFTKCYFGKAIRDEHGYCHVSDVDFGQFDLIILKGITPFPFEKLDGIPAHKIVLNLGSHYYFDTEKEARKIFDKNRDRIGALFAVSGEIYNLAGKEFPEFKTYLTPQGFDPEVFHPKITIGWAGNPCHADDHKRFIGIVVSVAKHFRCKRFIDFKFAISQTNEDISKAVEDSGIEFRKYETYEMPEYYRGVDVLLNASKSESICQPVVECAAMGKTIISTDTGYAKYIASDRVLIAHCIDDFIKHIEDIYETECLSVHACCENLTWDSVIGQTEAAIEEVLKCRQAS